VIALATTNVGKARELARLLAVPVEPIDGWDPPVEDGETFRDNALLKARAARAQAPADARVVADDSGLEVAALGGEPGVHSARFGGPGLDDAGRVQHLLQRLEGVDDRRARFVCVLVAIGRDGGEIVAEGVLEGSIADAPRGDGGFGYDPVFVPEGDTRTVAELAASEKDAISHRGRAARALVTALGA
jgi:XTP/dITP diphosphohydrolase